MIITSLYYTTFFLVLILAYLIMNNLLGNKLKTFYLLLTKMSFISLSLSLFIFLLSVLSLLSYKDISFISIIGEGQGPSFNKSLYNFMSENSGDGSTPSDGGASSSGDKSEKVQISPTFSGTINEGTVNVNTPRINISLSKESVNNVAAAISSAAGAGAGIKAVQHLGGTPATKLLVGAGVMLGTLAVTVGMSKFFNLNNKEEDKDNKFNLISNLENNSNSKDISSLLNEFPLNLLTDINQLLSVELIFLSVMFNIFLGDLLTRINYSKYIPQNKFGKFILFYVNRYINVWTKTKRLLLIISWICLVICVLFSKIFLYAILNS